MKKLLLYLLLFSTCIQGLVVTESLQENKPSKPFNDDRSWLEKNYDTIKLVGLIVGCAAIWGGSKYLMLRALHRRMTQWGNRSKKGPTRTHCSVPPAAGADPLIHAAYKGDLAEVKRLLAKEKVSPHIHDKEGNTAWHYATVAKQENVLEYARELAHQEANENQCPICLEEIHDAAQYARGSDNCIHFICTVCKSDPRMKDARCALCCQI